MNLKIFKKYKVQNKFRIWSSILTYLMIVSGLVGKWLVGWWAVVLVKPRQYTAV